MAAPQSNSNPADATNPNIDRSIALFERPSMDIADRPTFDAVKQAIAERYSPGGVEKFLKSLERAGLRVRSFEAVLQAGNLGPAAPAQYAKLSNSDQGQIREFYLASLERVDLNLRNKYFKLYAYY